MDEEDRVTLADVITESSALSADQRADAWLWAAEMGRDVARAAREAPNARWLGALADVLDQRLVWARFSLDQDDAVPERAAATAEMQRRGPDHPANVRLAALSARARSGDLEERAAAMRELGEDHRAFMASELGKAFGAQATSEMLDAHIEELRSALDVDRMSAALASRHVHELEEEREERVIRETLADQAEILRGPDDARTAALWGGAGGRAFRMLSRNGARRLIDEGHALRRRMRETPPA